MPTPPTQAQPKNPEASPETASNLGNPSRATQYVAGEKATAPATLPGSPERKTTGTPPPKSKPKPTEQAGGKGATRGGMHRQ
jgi:hypothetical protein